MVNSDELPARLAGRLRDLRRSAGLTGINLGGTLGWTQSKVSKIETGRTLPATADVTAWAKATGASSDELAELVDLLREVVADEQRWRSKFQRGPAAVQRQHAEMARAAALVRNFEPSVVPGLLQTPEYARNRILEVARRHGTDTSDETVGTAVAARMQRGQALFDTSKRFEFVIGEPALRWRLCSPSAMRAQLTRLLTLFDLPNVEIAVLPFSAALDDTPQHGFIMFDDLVIVESWSDERGFSGPESAIYGAVFGEFKSRSAAGDDAMRVISHAADAAASLA
jgi:transcriptional regulator with XRE-family HTH domain